MDVSRSGSHVPRSRQQWRNDYGDGWGYGDDYRRAPITRSGGARPAIAPEAPPKVAFHSNFVANSIVIDSQGRMLYFILSPTEAYQYPISVGREGFSWTGTEVISRKQEWPDWHPPKEMIARDPRLPDKMTGGLKNPLGALALYLGNTLYRIHGTNDPDQHRPRRVVGLLPHDERARAAFGVDRQRRNAGHSAEAHWRRRRHRHRRPRTVGTAGRSLRA